MPRPVVAHRVIAMDGTAIITASAAILGVAVSGIFTVISQWQARTSDRLKWEREALERSRTRFHAERLEAYTNFLAAQANAHGYMTDMAIQTTRRPSRWR